ncbi:E3 ubiquitin-protein ligase PUB23-like [Curcuma longa]|uniref:E3 ubiquitin-protein ligase PUB23-like n=1 Tax=Curcuma longa TaxID=136217 RepID=UPI003D9DCE39
MDDSSSIEVPRLFLCPISLEIMRDPVTAATGMTYDRRSIERWLLVDGRSTCPVTQLQLPPDAAASLTPNHTLRRLIQSWSAAAGEAVDRIPTPRAPVDRTEVAGLIRDLSVRQRRVDVLKKVVELAGESESNRRCMARAGVPAKMADILMETSKIDGEEVSLALDVLYVLRVLPEDWKPIVDGAGNRLIDTMVRILMHGCDEVKSTATLILKSIVEAANRGTLEQLSPLFFQSVLRSIRDDVGGGLTSTSSAPHAALKILAHVAPWGRNRVKIVEAGGVWASVELELAGAAEGDKRRRRRTELNLALLRQLCECAEGRAELVRHAAGIAVVAKRVLRVSPAATEQGVAILCAVGRRLATEERVVREMLAVGAVAKLCLALQANCSARAKEKARRVLSLNSSAWKDSPCVQSCLSI